MARYFTMKASVGVNERKFHRKQKASHSHEDQDQFVKDVKAFMAAEYRTTTDKVETSQISSGQPEPSYSTEV